MFDIDPYRDEVKETLTPCTVMPSINRVNGKHSHTLYLVPKPPESALTLGGRIREKREAMGLSQTAMGKLLGVSKIAVSNWERDVYAPKAENFRALEREFGVTEQRLRFGAAADLPEFMPVGLLARALLDQEAAELPPGLREEYAEFLVDLITKYPVGLSFVNQSVGFLSAREVVTFYLDPADFEKGGGDDAQALLSAAGNALRRAMDAVETEARRRSAAGVRSPTRDEMRSMTERVKETVRGATKEETPPPPERP